MAEIHITLRDTPSGGVAIYTDFKPAIGQPCTPAQGHALEIINRTQKQWGLKAESAEWVCNARGDEECLHYGACFESGSCVRPQPSRSAT